MRLDFLFFKIRLHFRSQLLPPAANFLSHRGNFPPFSQPKPAPADGLRVRLPDPLLPDEDAGS